jgi:hypothetical protein
MSFKSFLKKVGKGIGKVTSVASPLLMATGVGAPLALGLGAAGGFASGHNLGEVLKGAAKNFALGGAGKALSGGLKGLSVLSKADMLKNGVQGASKVAGIGPGGVPMIDQNGAYAAGQPGAGGGGGVLDAIKGLLGGNSSGGGTDWGKILGTVGKVGVGAAGAYSSAKQQGKADDLRDKALKLVEGEYAEGAPLRKLGMAGLTDPRVRDLSSVFAPAQTNYQRLAI